MTAAPPIRVSIIGAGNVLPAYLQALDRLIPRGFAALGPVCARRSEVRAALKSQRPGIHLVSDPAAALDSDADVIVILTPPASHAELVEQALERGKHVLVEKPLASNYADAKRLVELAEARGRHLVSAPFVQLAPTFRALWTRLQSGAIGKIHSARGLYGNPGSTWARWYHSGEIGALAELGIYNLKSITSLVGPVTEVFAADTTAVAKREIEGEIVSNSAPDVSHILLRHANGALSSIVSSHAIQRYRRPALELYGTAGTANLLGDDWDPRGFEIWQNDRGSWEEFDPIEPTWLWTDGLRELVMALRANCEPLHDPFHDLHLLEIIEAADRSARERHVVPVQSRFGALHLNLDLSSERHHLHDHTRPADEQ